MGFRGRGRARADSTRSALRATIHPKTYARAVLVVRYLFGHKAIFPSDLPKVGNRQIPLNSALTSRDVVNQSKALSQSISTMNYPQLVQKNI